MAAAYYHTGYMQEALIEMEKGRGLHGLDVIEPIRIDALTALFSGKFAPAQARLEEVSRLSSQAIGDTYLALAYSTRATRAAHEPCSKRWRTALRRQQRPEPGPPWQASWPLRATQPMPAASSIEC